MRLNINEGIALPAPPCPCTVWYRARREAQVRQAVQAVQTVPICPVIGGAKTEKGVQTPFVTEAGYVSKVCKLFVNKALNYFTRILLCSEPELLHYRFRADTIGSASGGTKYLDVSSVFRYN